MKALVSHRQKATLVNIKPPEIAKSDDVKLHVNCAGLCKTDIWAATGIIKTKNNYPLGHEFCGTVIELGDAVTDVTLGQRIAVNPIIPCGTCEDCLRGLTHLCSNTKMLGIDSPGAFAEFIVVPRNLCYTIPSSLSPELVAYSEPVAAALSIRSCNLSPNLRIGIVGSDRISALTEYILNTLKIELVNASQKEPVDVLIVTSTDHNNKNNAKPERTTASLLNLVKAGGTLVLKGRSPYLWALDVKQVVTKRLTLKGINYAPFSQAIEFLYEHKEGLIPFLGQHFSLVDYEKAFRCSDDKKVFLDLSVA
ncbi:MAG: alcohol dehydrogenase catalytic domain-containing protein [Spirochaetota bacterium]